MADNTGGGGTSMLAFLVGGLLVAVVVLGFFMYSGGHMGGTSVSVPSHMSVDVKPGGLNVY
ncbi:MAG TPA: hypothetical protein VHL34_21280 [Rhizomicrobium sp.]|jgi:hypothetical protein|nr:hypothetical protein [Rhizomicrobium sp.]